MMQWRVAACALASVVGVPGCGGSPAAPTGTAAPTPTTAAAFAIGMPIALPDLGSAAYGLWPFGVHGSSHAVDGHPGWDVEYRPGASVLAAATGTVQSVFADANGSGRVTVQISHAVNGRPYRTVYTNIGSVAQGVTAGAGVSAGQPIGTAGTLTLAIGTRTVTFSMTHFQVDDFSQSAGSSNVNAVSPETFLDGAGRSVFDTVWSTAAYNQELCEPFPANPRDAVFPLTRTWTRQTGSGPIRIDVRRLDPTTNAYDYSLVDAQGATEAGTVSVTPAGTLSAIDLRPSGGTAVRPGVYDIVGGSMRLDLADGTGGRPMSLANASTYTTSPP